jgi:adenylosuccinate lyase
MQANLDRYSGLVYSQRVLLAPTQAGLSREDAYQAVQRNAMKVWLEGKDFLEELQADPAVSAKISPAGLAACFDLGYHFKHVDAVFRRVFGD